MNPSNLKYTKEHEWVRVEPDGLGTVGGTAFAVENLGDIVFLELPDVGTRLSQDEQFGEVESVKAVSDLYSPVTGKVIERNQAVIDTPEVVNESPYESGWLLRVELAEASEVDVLMSSDQYELFLASETN